MDKISLLLVDDEEDAFILVQRHLKNSPTYQYSVQWEPDEEKAVSLMALNKFDVHLIDYRLPRFTGIEVFLKAKAAGCRGPVIIITSMANPKFDVAAMEAGADDYLHKESIVDGMLERAIRYAIERKHTQQLITERQLALSHTLKMSTLGKMTSSIAHEINNPLAIIAGRISIMEDRAKDGRLGSEEALLQLGKLKETAGRISKIVRTLYSYARDSTYDPYEKAAAWKIIQDACELSSPKLACEHVELRCTDIPQHLELDCKPLEISHVLVNLICNAADAVKSMESRWVRIEAHEDSDCVVFTVTDSGAGIPESLSAKILKPFFSTKTNGMGMGLGLSIGRDIVEKHGGTLAIDSASANTKFVVRLPKIKGEAKDERPLTILVVDDEEAIVGSISDAFEHQGYQVLTASNGIEAYQRLRDGKIDVVVSDLVMPGFDGAALFRRAKEEGLLPRKFIFMTGQSIQSLTEEFRSHSVDIFAKPFSLSQLLDAVKDFARTLPPS